MIDCGMEKGREREANRKIRGKIYNPDGIGSPPRIFLAFRGKAMPIRSIAEEMGVTPGAIRRRWLKGLPLDMVKGYWPERGQAQKKKRV